MIRTNLFQPTDAHKIVAEAGRFSLLEYERDMSITPDTASTAFFASQMNVRKKQVIAKLNNDGGVIVQAGAMQLMVGQLQAATNIKGAGDLMKKFIGSKVTGETTVKPRYEGTGLLVLEPTYRYPNASDAEKRNDYLASFDGSIFASGSHTVVGTVLVRTSDELTASQQKALEANIIAELTNIENQKQKKAHGMHLKVEQFDRNCMAHNHPCIVGDREMELMSGQGPFINAQTALAVIGNPRGVNSSFFTLYGQNGEHAGLLAAIEVMAVVGHSKKTAHQISASSSTGSLT